MTRYREARGVWILKGGKTMPGLKEKLDLVIPFAPPLAVFPPWKPIYLFYFCCSQPSSLKKFTPLCCFCPHNSKRCVSLEDVVLAQSHPTNFSAVRGRIPTVSSSGQRSPHTHTHTPQLYGHHLAPKGTGCSTHSLTFSQKILQTGPLRLG